MCDNYIKSIKYCCTYIKICNYGIEKENILRESIPLFSPIFLGRLPNKVSFSIFFPENDGNNNFSLNILWIGFSNLILFREFNTIIRQKIYFPLPFELCRVRASFGDGDTQYTCKFTIQTYIFLLDFWMETGSQRSIVYVSIHLMATSDHLCR